MQTFCYKCGKLFDDNNLQIENLCQECFIELHPLIRIPAHLQIKLCKKCNRYFLKKRWISSHFQEFESLLDFAVKDIIPFQLQIAPGTELEIKTDIYENLESILRTNLIHIDIKARGHAHETLHEYTETYSTQEVNLIFTICQSCLSLKRGEYQAVLHILTPEREMLEQERDYILSYVENEVENSKNTDYTAYISKFTMKKGKVTFYIGSEKFARNLASKLSFNLGSSVKETYKFGSRKIPKEVKQNKLYISLYLPHFSVGDLLWDNDTPLYVTNIKGKNAVCINLNNYEQIKRPLKLLKNVIILRHFNEVNSLIYYSQTKDMNQFMDLEIFQIFEILISPQLDNLELGKTVEGFEVDGKLYLIPPFYKT